MRLKIGEGSFRALRATSLTFITPPPLSWAHCQHNQPATGLHAAIWLSVWMRFAKGSFLVFLFLGSILFLFLARYVWMYGVEWLDCDGDVFIREPKLIQYRRRIEMLQLRFLPANVGSNLNATGHKRLYGSTHPLNNKAITEYNIWPGCPLLLVLQKVPSESS